MIQLNTFGMKILKFFHIIFLTFWAGAVFYLFMGFMICKYQDENFITGMIKGIELYDKYIIIPSMFGLLITGLIYSIFTAWGFKKYYWIIIKWVMTISFVYIGSIVADNVDSKLLTIISRNNFSKNDPEFLATLLKAQQVFGIMILMFMIVVLISIFKPFGKINKRQEKNKE
jgi:hypothetical protein